MQTINIILLLLYCYYIINKKLSKYAIKAAHEVSAAKEQISVEKNQ